MVEHVAPIGELLLGVGRIVWRNPACQTRVVVEPLGVQRVERTPAQGVEHAHRHEQRLGQVDADETARVGRATQLAELLFNCCQGGFGLLGGGFLHRHGEHALVAIFILGKEGQTGQRFRQPEADGDLALGLAFLQRGEKGMIVVAEYQRAHRQSFHLLRENCLPLCIIDRRARQRALRIEVAQPVAAVYLDFSIQGKRVSTHLYHAPQRLAQRLGRVRRSDRGLAPVQKVRGVAAVEGLLWVGVEVKDHFAGRGRAHVAPR